MIKPEDCRLCATLGQFATQEEAFAHWDSMNVTDEEADQHTIHLVDRCIHALGRKC